MKKTIRNLVLEAVGVLGVYFLLLHRLSGSNLAAGVLCPGPHLPNYYPALIFLFLFCRLYMILLPGIVLSRIGLAWFRMRQPGGHPK